MHKIVEDVLAGKREMNLDQMYPFMSNEDMKKPYPGAVPNQGNLRGIRFLNFIRRTGSHRMLHKYKVV